MPLPALFQTPARFPASIASLGQYAGGLKRAQWRLIRQSYAKPSVAFNRNIHTERSIVERSSDTASFKKLGEKFQGCEDIFERPIRADPYSSLFCVKQGHASPLVTIGVFIDSGSADESHHGAAHFLEHINFRGFPLRKGSKMTPSFNEDIEKRGAELNAFTSREYTHYYLTCLKDDIPWGLSILKKLVFDADIVPEDVEQEKSVILRELEEVDQSVEEFLVDRLHENSLRNYGDIEEAPHRLGRTILGTPNSITETTPMHLEQYRDSFRHSKRIHILCIGDCDMDLSDLGATVDSIFTPMGPSRVLAPPKEPDTISFVASTGLYPPVTTLGNPVPYSSSLICAFPVALDDTTKTTTISAYQFLSRLITDFLAARTYSESPYGHGFFYRYRKPQTGMIGWFMSSDPPMGSLAPGSQSFDRESLTRGAPTISLTQLQHDFRDSIMEFKEHLQNLSNEKILDLKVEMISELRGGALHDPTLSRGLDALGRLVMYGDDNHDRAEAIKSLTHTDLLRVWNKMISSRASLFMVDGESR